ncbi:vesicular-fusion protein sec17 [Metarhizium rileyi]|uniref:Gamma-soluble NSF attachment protein n=1 Tax=Metarhizium rileyi (strain RCEF 4871) TaxID=1649241 RepID=A0A167EEW3_METRR|nr:vesicular-fusion protein sec17 [Metarhizium rileyi RCEF 4871]
MSQDPRALLKQAEEKLSRGGGFWGFMSDKSDTYSTAVQLFTSAANAFEKQGSYVEAGKAHERAAEVLTHKADDDLDGNRALIKAFEMYLKAVDPLNAGRCLKAITDQLRHFEVKYRSDYIDRAGKLYAKMANMYEDELNDMGAASEMYQAAVDASNSEKYPLQARPLRIKVADTAALHFVSLIDVDGKTSTSYMKKAMDIYATVAKEIYQKNPSDKLGRSCLLKSGICLLATRDSVYFKRIIENEVPFVIPGFSITQEGLLLTNLATALRDQDLQKFAKLVTANRTNNILVEWHMTMLRTAGTYMADIDDMNEEMKKCERLWLQGEQQKQQEKQQRDWGQENHQFSRYQSSSQYQQPSQYQPSSQYQPPSQYQPQPGNYLQEKSLPQPHHPSEKPMSQPHHASDEQDETVADAIPFV